MPPTPSISDAGRPQPPSASCGMAPPESMRAPTHTLWLAEPIKALHRAPRPSLNPREAAAVTWCPSSASRHSRCLPVSAPPSISAAAAYPATRTAPRASLYGKESAAALSVHPPSRSRAHALTVVVPPALSRSAARHVAPSQPLPPLCSSSCSRRQTAPAHTLASAFHARPRNLAELRRAPDRNCC